MNRKRPWRGGLRVKLCVKNRFENVQKSEKNHRNDAKPKLKHFEKIP
jgi:hypothetical protein